MLAKLDMLDKLAETAAMILIIGLFAYLHTANAYGISDQNSLKSQSCRRWVPRTPNKTTQQEHVHGREDRTLRRSRANSGTLRTLFPAPSNATAVLETVRAGGTRRWRNGD